MAAMRGEQHSLFSDALAQFKEIRVKISQLFEVVNDKQEDFPQILIENVFSAARAVLHTDFDLVSPSLIDSIVSALRQLLSPDTVETISLLLLDIKVRLTVYTATQVANLALACIVLLCGDTHFSLTDMPVLLFLFIVHLGASSGASVISVCSAAIDTLPPSLLLQAGSALLKAPTVDTMPPIFIPKFRSNPDRVASISVSVLVAAVRRHPTELSSLVPLIAHSAVAQERLSTQQLDNNSDYQSIRGAIGLALYVAAANAPLPGQTPSHAYEMAISVLIQLICEPLCMMTRMIPQDDSPFSSLGSRIDSIARLFSLPSAAATIIRLTAASQRPSVISETVCALSTFTRVGTRGAHAALTTVLTILSQQTEKMVPLQQRTEVLSVARELAQKPSLDTLERLYCAVNGTVDQKPSACDLAQFVVKQGLLISPLTVFILGSSDSEASLEFGRAIVQESIAGMRYDCLPIHIVESIKNHTAEPIVALIWTCFVAFSAWTHVASPHGEGQYLERAISCFADGAVKCEALRSLAFEVTGEENIDEGLQDLFQYACYAFIMLHTAVATPTLRDHFNRSGFAETLCYVTFSDLRGGELMEEKEASSPGTRVTADDIYIPPPEYCNVSELWSQLPAPTVSEIYELIQRRPVLFSRSAAGVICSRVWARGSATPDSAVADSDAFIPSGSLAEMAYVQPTERRAADLVDCPVPILTSSVPALLAVDLKFVIEQIITPLVNCSIYQNTDQVGPATKAAANVGSILQLISTVVDEKSAAFASSIFEYSLTQCMGVMERVLAEPRPLTAIALGSAFSPAYRLFVSTLLRSSSIPLSPDILNGVISLIFRLDQLAPATHDLIIHQQKPIISATAFRQDSVVSQKGFFRSIISHTTAKIESSEEDELMKNLKRVFAASAELPQVWMTSPDAGSALIRFFDQVSQTEERRFELIRLVSAIINRYQASELLQEVLYPLPKPTSVPSPSVQYITALSAPLCVFDRALDHLAASLYSIATTTKSPSLFLASVRLFSIVLGRIAALGLPMTFFDSQYNSFISHSPQPQVFTEFTVESAQNSLAILCLTQKFAVQSSDVAWEAATSLLSSIASQGRATDRVWHLVTVFTCDAMPQRALVAISEILMASASSGDGAAHQVDSTDPIVLASSTALARPRSSQNAHDALERAGDALNMGAAIFTSTHNTLNQGIPICLVPTAVFLMRAIIFFPTSLAQTALTVFSKSLQFPIISLFALRVFSVPMALSTAATCLVLAQSFQNLNVDRSQAIKALRLRQASGQTDEMPILENIGRILAQSREESHELEHQDMTSDLTEDSELTAG